MSNKQSHGGVSQRRTGPSWWSIGSERRSTQIVRFLKRYTNNCDYQLIVRSSHDVQQHAVACLHRVVTRWNSCSDIVDDPPGDQVGSVDLRAEKPFVVVSVNSEVRVLEVITIRLTWGRRRKEGRYSQDVRQIHHLLATGYGQNDSRSDGRTTHDCAEDLSRSFLRGGVFREEDDR